MEDRENFEGCCVELVVVVFSRNNTINQQNHLGQVLKETHLEYNQLETKVEELERKIASEETEKRE